jgi:amidase
VRLELAAGLSVGLGHVDHARPADPRRRHLFAITGQPAISVPAGFTSEGLPVGLQIVGRRFADATVLRVAAAFEAARPWARRRPPVD